MSHSAVSKFYNKAFNDDPAPFLPNNFLVYRVGIEYSDNIGYSSNMTESNFLIKLENENYMIDLRK